MGSRQVALGSWLLGVLLTACSFTDEVGFDGQPPAGQGGSGALPGGGGASSGDPNAPIGRERCEAPPCATGEACIAGVDCASLVCEGDESAARCAAPSPNDQQKNGDETDVDCGGAVAPACADDRQCLAGRDCASRSCVDGTCRAPSASDGVQNGNETDVDCGRGPDGVDTEAPPCAAGLRCLQASDCAEGYCPAPADAAAPALCVTPTANDGVQNGNESDVDCGASAAGFDTQAPGCAPTQRCTAHTDCASNGCIEQGPNAGTCAEAPSCTMYNGGLTCGAGDFDYNNLGAAGDAAALPLASHESCCTSLPLPPSFTDANHPGKQVYVDKYEITAGRMRKFVERITAQSNGVPNVRAWLGAHLQAHPATVWNDGADAARNWTRWLPANTGGRAGDANQDNWNSNAVSLFPARGQGNQPSPAWGNVGTDFLFGLGGYYFYIHGHNCDTGSGYPTYHYDEDVLRAVHNGTGPRRLSRENLDRRALNCTPQAMFAAFCAWDGGQLITEKALEALTSVPYANRNPGNANALGRLPARATSNWTGDAGATPTQYNVPTINLEAARIAPPGRMVNDRVAFSEGGVEYGPWMDLRGNLQEIAILADSNPLRFAGIHYDGIGRDSVRGTRDTQAQYAEMKAGSAGARCMRWREP